MPDERSESTMAGIRDYLVQRGYSARAIKEIELRFDRDAPSWLVLSEALASQMEVNLALMEALSTIARDEPDSIQRRAMSKALDALKASLEISSRTVKPALAEASRLADRVKPHPPEGPWEDDA